MTFIASVKSVFLNYKDFSGRSRRAEFWNFILFMIIACIALTVVNSMLFGPTLTQEFKITIDEAGKQVPHSSYSKNYTGGWLTNIFSLICLIPWLAVTWRRLHDTNRAGWYCLLPIAIGAIGFSLLYLTSVPTPIDSSLIPEGVTMPENIFNPKLGILIPFILTYLASIILVIYWLASKSDQNANKFGEPVNNIQL